MFSQPDRDLVARCFDDVGQFLQQHTHIARVALKERDCAPNRQRQRGDHHYAERDNGNHFGPRPANFLFQQRRQHMHQRVHQQAGEERAYQPLVQYHQ